MIEYFFRRAFAYSLDILIIALIVELVVSSNINFQYKKYNDYYNEYVEEHELYIQHQNIEKIESCEKLVEYINKEELVHKKYIDVYEKIKPLKKDDTTKEEFDEKCNKLVDDYNSYDVTIDDYNAMVNKYNRILGKNSVINYSLTAVLSLLYFVLFQGFTGGQTLGKKLMRVKVVSKEENKDVSYKQLFLRTLFLNSIVCYVLMLIGAYLLSDLVYTIFVSAITFIDTLLMGVLSVMVFVNKERKGLHDVLFGTKVVVIDFKGNIIYDGKEILEEEPKINDEEKTEIIISKKQKKSKNKKR